MAFVYVYRGRFTGHIFYIKASAKIPMLRDGTTIDLNTKSGQELFFGREALKSMGINPDNEDQMNRMAKVDLADPVISRGFFENEMLRGQKVNPDSTLEREAWVKTHGTPTLLPMWEGIPCAGGEESDLIPPEHPGSIMVNTRRWSAALGKCVETPGIVTDQMVHQAIHWTRSKWIDRAPDMTKQMERMCLNPMLKITNMTKTMKEDFVAAWMAAGKPVLDP